ncbi:ATP-binding protein [Stenotrophomonas sp.]|uniref:hybrid sensor histidine kinase/response regulator n=1 Tax=Stenotrophomonas sp. TaxID=69392 RepID=UPI002FC71D1A
MARKVLRGAGQGIWLWLLLVVCPCAMASAVLDLPWPRQLGRGEGLPAMGIRAMAEDATGYLWMAGSSGLLRFDGRTTRVWRREDGLVDTTLEVLHIDVRDRLWLGTATHGLAMMPADRQRFEHPDPAAPAALRQGRIHAIASDRTGTLWVIGADRRLYRRLADGPDWRAVDVAATQVTALASDVAGTVWAGTSHGVRRLRGGLAAPVDALPDAVSALWADPQGALHVTDAQGVHLLDAEGGVRRPPAAGQPLLRSEDGALWLQQAAGLVLHRPGDTQRIPLRALHGPPQEGVQMRQALQDRHGDIWLLSRAHGVWRLPAHWRAFAALPSAGDGLPGLHSHYALALAGGADGGLWVAGSEGRLQRLDLRTGASSDHVRYAHAGFSATPVGMAEDPQQRLWLASAGQLLRYDPARRRARRWPLELPNASAALNLQACADGQVWLAHPARLQQWSAQGERLRDEAPAALGLAPGMAARQLLCARDGTLWATDQDGLKYWDAARARFLAAAAPGPAVAAVAEAADGSLWLSRQDALERHRWQDGALQRTHRFDAAAGYPQVRAEALVVDARGIVWAGAARGLVRLDPRQGQARVLGDADGLPAQEILGQRLVRLRSGALAAAVREGGLLLHEPGSMPQRPPPVLVVNAVRLQRDDAEVIVQPEAHAVALHARDRNIQLAVNLLGRGDPDRIQYRFRLPGYDQEWIDTGAVAQRIFARLPVGEHRVLIQARHGDGPWSAAQRLVLSVAPAWWQTPCGTLALGAAALLAALAAARGIAYAVRQRQRRLASRLRRQRAEEASAERTRFLGQLGQRIRLPMTRVSGWSQLLLDGPLDARQRAQAHSLHQAGLHLVQLVDDALDLASIEAGRLHLQPAPFAPARLLQELHALLQPVAQAKGLQLDWTSTLAADTWLLGDVRRLRQILLNLVGNAVKFTGHGRVEVAAHPGVGGRGVMLRVTDTGPGMSPAQVQRLFQRFEQADGADTLARHGGSGLGLAISRELAQAMGGEIDVASRPGQGTRFQVWLPLQAATAPAAPPTVPGPAAAAPGTPAGHALLLWQGTTAEVIAALLRAQGLIVTAAEPGPGWGAGVQARPWALVVADPDQRVCGEPIGALLSRVLPGVPRLALTARADANAERDALAAGFAVFLRLPMERQALHAALARCRVCR